MHRIKLNDRMTFPSVLNLNKFVEPSSMVCAHVLSGLHACVHVLNGLHACAHVLNGLHACAHVLNGLHACTHVAVYMC